MHHYYLLSASHSSIFCRRDSFITHRAFCDALAEENNKANEGQLPKIGPNLQCHSSHPSPLHPYNTNPPKKYQYHPRHAVPTHHPKLPPSPTRTHSLSHRPQNLTLLPSLFSSLLPPKQVNKQHSHIHHNTNTNTNKDNNLVCLQSKPFKLAFENQDTPVREIKPKNRRIMVT